MARPEGDRRCPRASDADDRGRDPAARGHFAGRFLAGARTAGDPRRSVAGTESLSLQGRRGRLVEPRPGAALDPDSGLPTRVTDRNTGIELVLVPAGEYDRGSKPRSDRRRRRIDDDEMPVHRVEISRAFYLGVTEVTQGDWLKALPENPSRFQKGDEFPVENVGFDVVETFLRRSGFRLPTEAEWEYACRARGADPGTDPDPVAALELFGWTRETSGRSTQPVGLREANAFGVKDMLGNVPEWTATWYDPAEYHRSVPSVTDPTGPKRGQEIVVRGCAFTDAATDCSCAARGHVHPRARGPIGLRIAHDAP